MARRSKSAEESPIVSRDRVIEVMRRELRTAIYVEKRFSDAGEIVTASGVPLRVVRSYMANDPGEVREACLSNALSIAVVLGQRTVNAVLSLIGYGGAEPLDEPDTDEPMVLTADIMSNAAVIAKAAARGKIRHTDERAVKEAADHIVQDALKLSSIGDAE